MFVAGCLTRLDCCRTSFRFVGEEEKEAMPLASKPASLNASQNGHSFTTLHLRIITIECYLREPLRPLQILYLAALKRFEAVLDV